MDFKKLFIIPDENPDDKLENKRPETKKSESGTKFPTDTTSFPSVESQPIVEPISTPPPANSLFGFGSTPAPKVETYVPNIGSPNGVSAERLAKTADMYQKGFEALNQPGYDFFEFYQSIVGADGVNNPQFYKMALSMGVAMDKTITKDKLIMQSEFYISEIQKQYQEFSGQGTAKRNSILSQKSNEAQALTGELDLMHQQLEMLQTQIKDRESKLAVIDSKYAPMLSEVDEKIMANDMVKDKLIGSLESVKNGIKNNL
jgi:hypothetical protein